MGCGDAAPRPILVFAAASLEDAMLEVRRRLHRDARDRGRAQHRGSNVLAQQIEAGAPADVFVSADARWIDDLIASGLARSARRAASSSPTGWW